MNDKLNVDTDNIEIDNFIRNNYRSNSCREDLNFKFPRNFVPTLKPRIGHVVPSPISLGPLDGSFLIEEDYLNLYEDSK